MAAAASAATAAAERRGRLPPVTVAGDAMSTSSPSAALPLPLSPFLAMPPDLMAIREPTGAASAGAAGATAGATAGVADAADTDTDTAPRPSCSRHERRWW